MKNCGFFVFLVFDKNKNRKPLKTKIMNITDNVLRALEGVSPEQAYVGLDLSVKNNFFVFVCQNMFSARANQSPNHSPSEHGWGLQIVREIMSKHDGYIMTEQKDGVFTATIALPLK